MLKFQKNIAVMITDFETKGGGNYPVLSVPPSDSVLLISISSAKKKKK